MEPVTRYVWQTILKLFEAGWYCIDDYIWVKSNPMPGYWPTCLRDGWDYCFHLAKSKKIYIDQEAVRFPIEEIRGEQFYPPQQRQQQWFWMNYLPMGWKNPRVAVQCFLCAYSL